MLPEPFLSPAFSGPAKRSLGEKIKSDNMWIQFYLFLISGEGSDDGKAMLESFFPKLAECIFVPSKASDPHTSHLNLMSVTK